MVPGKNSRLAVPESIPSDNFQQHLNVQTQLLYNCYIINPKMWVM